MVGIGVNHHHAIGHDADVTGPEYQIAALETLIVGIAENLHA